MAETITIEVSGHDVPYFLAAIKLCKKLVYPFSIKVKSRRQMSYNNFERYILEVSNVDVAYTFGIEFGKQQQICRRRMEKAAWMRKYRNRNVETAQQ